jgi:hypothetical protein
MPGALSIDEQRIVNQAISTYATGQRALWCREVIAYLGEFVWAGANPKWDTTDASNLAMNCWCAPIYIAYQNDRLSKKTVEEFDLKGFQYPTLSGLHASQRAAHEFLKGSLAGGDEGVPGDLLLFYVDSLASATDPTVPQKQREYSASVPLAKCPIHVAVNMGPGMCVSLWTEPNGYNKYQYCSIRELSEIIRVQKKANCIVKSIEPFWIAGKKTASCCYITTAVCNAQGLADDCAELTTLRWFRDSVMRATPDGARLVAEYYATAPDIVAAIDGRPDAAAVYAALHKNFIAPSVEAVGQGDFVRAERMFTAMMGNFTQS